MLKLDEEGNLNGFGQIDPPNFIRAKRRPKRNNRRATNKAPSGQGDVGRFNTVTNARSSNITKELTRENWLKRRAKKV